MGYKYEYEYGLIIVYGFKLKLLKTIRKLLSYWYYQEFYRCLNK